MGWGQVIGKIFDWLPGKNESLRNQEENIKRQMDELQKKSSSVDNRNKYAYLACKLREVQQKLKNN